MGAHINSHEVPRLTLSQALEGLHHLAIVSEALQRVATAVIDRGGRGCRQESLHRVGANRLTDRDRKVGTLRVTGIVFERNIDGWLTSLQATFPVQVVRDASGGVTLKDGSH